MFSPAQSSDILAVLNSIVETRHKIATLKEDEREAIKGLVEKHEGEISKNEVTQFLKWMMTPEKQADDHENMEEAQTKFDELMRNRNKYKQVGGSSSLELSDLD